jgi:uncharacterized protein with von Willebrand factor type A (vWA) domain
MTEGAAGREWPERIARFGGALRAHGLGTSLRDEIDGAQAVSIVDGHDRDEVRAALAIALKIRPSDLEVFERLFEGFWRSGKTNQGTTAPPAPRAANAREHPARRRPTILRWDPDARQMVDGPAAPSEGDHPGYSPEALLRRRSFDTIQPSDRDLASMERMIAQLARRLATRKSRRLVPTLGRGLPDLRRSLRRALRTSGEVLTFARRARAIDTPRLTFLFDTSGSMDGHARFLLMFVLSVRRALPKAEVFAFNTQLTRLTNPLARLPRDDLRLALERLAVHVPDWSGGTQIGESLWAFVRGHLDRCVDAKTVVVIVSDGLDRGDPGSLAGAVRAIRARAKKLVWLNPLMGDAAYEPLTRGMQAALPFVDHFAPAHNLESLEQVLSHLSRLPRLPHVQRLPHLPVRP